MSNPVALKILPWNGYKGALSLTFDDGDPSQLDVAIPEMEKRGLRGTFYLIAERLSRPEEWKKAAASGQEIGNHSLSHKRAKTLSPGEEEKQIGEAKKILENLCGVPIPTFAYPFTEITPALRQLAQSHHLLSRGGMGEYYFPQNSEPDWAYLPSQVAYSATSPGVYKGWADEALRRQSWTIPQLHAFEGTATGWQPMSRKNLVEFLDYLAEVKKDLWVAPLGEVGSYWRAQKAVEETKGKEVGNRTTWIWERTDLFPKGIQLKVMMQDKNLKLSQNGKALSPSPEGDFSISFDEQELTLEKA